MKTKLIAVLLLAGSSLLAAPRFTFGIGIGVPAAPVYVAPAYVPPPPVYYAPAPVYAVPAYVPPAPGPGYTWVTGYWYFSGGRRFWHPGYWAPRPRVIAGRGWRYR